MPSALSSIIDVVGLEVSCSGSVVADPDAAWRVELPTPEHRCGIWIANRGRPRWIAHADGADELFRGEVILLRADAVATPIAVATSLSVVDAPSAPEDDPVFASLGVRPDSGVVFGTFALGALGDEVLRPPRVHVAEQWTGVQSATLPALDLLATLAQVDRCGDVYGRAIARAVVVSALDTWVPPFLRDNGLRRSIEFVLAASKPPPLESIPRPRQCSVRSMHRRFRETTGMAPGEFVRWWSAVRARAALVRGVPEAEVAATLGYASVRSLRRLLGRS